MRGSNHPTTPNLRTSVQHESRLIPRSTSPQIFRRSWSQPLLPLQSHELSLDSSTVNNHTLPDLSLRGDAFNPFVVRTNSSTESNDRELMFTTTSSQQASHSSSSRELRTPKSSDTHRTYIADALGFQKQERVLNYESKPVSPTKKRSPPRKPSPLMSDKFNQDSQKEFVCLIPSSSSLTSLRKPRQNVVAKLNPSTILQAPGLRNDFYSNLISWNKSTGKILVGLKSRIFVWCANNQVNEIAMEHQGMITAITCSNHSYFTYATLNGVIALGDLKSNQILTSIKLPNNCVYCLQWSPNSDIIFAGDARGEVLILQINRRENEYLFHEQSRMKSNGEQICGIAISMDSKEVAVGGNDNKCTIWDIESIDHPQLKHTLFHTAAVKALAYCPWSTSLLASGGGSKDRNVRFWHTKSGTLLQTIATDWQITSILWSTIRKELVVTFGFSTGKEDVMLRVFSYPNMQYLKEVSASPNTRTLSACLSPDGCSVCTAINDETIHIYKIWSSLLKFTPSSQIFGKGSYQSSIIELVEGVDETGDLIR